VCGVSGGTFFLEGKTLKRMENLKKREILKYVCWTEFGNLSKRKEFVIRISVRNGDGGMVMSSGTLSLKNKRFYSVACNVSEKKEVEQFIHERIIKSSSPLENVFSVQCVANGCEKHSVLEYYENIYSGEKTRVYRVELKRDGTQMVAFLTTKVGSEDTSSEKKEIVELFDESSPHWDVIMSISGYRSVIEWLERSVERYMSEIKDSSNGISILDCACGGGYTVQTLHEKSKSFGIDSKLMGIDISTGMLQKALEKGPKLFNIGMACHDLDQKIDMIPNESFDLITCLGAIEFLSNFETVTIMEFKRLLKKNGQMLLTTQYQPNEDESNVEIDKDGHRLYNRQILDRILAQQGLVATNYEIIERAYTSDRKKIPFIAFKVQHKH